MTTKLIVTIDTEEEGLWSGSFSADKNSVRNIKGLPEFQSICDNHHLQPVYLVNSPVLEDPSSISILKGIHDQGLCEIGCHIHPWNTPPVAHGISSEQSYLCNLDKETQKLKLERVTGDIENSFGERPRSFRAGRYGLDKEGARILENLGYTVDSSVCPFTDYSGDGGPDFRGYPWEPYYIGSTLFEQNAANTGLLEVPVSFGFNWRDFNFAHQIYEILGAKNLRSLRLRGIFERLGILQKYKFSPEKHGAKKLKKLARIYDENRISALVMMFHSSSLAPGMSPYVTDTKALHQFLNTIDIVIDYCLHTLHFKSATLSQFQASFDESKGPENSKVSASK